MRSASSCFDIGIFLSCLIRRLQRFAGSFPLKLAGPAIILLQSALDCLLVVATHTNPNKAMRTFVYGMRRLSCTISTTNRKKIRNLDLLVVAGGRQQSSSSKPAFAASAGAELTAASKSQRHFAAPPIAAAVRN